MWNADLSHVREEDARCIIIIADQEVRRCCLKSGGMLNKKSSRTSPKHGLARSGHSGHMSLTGTLQHRAVPQLYRLESWAAAPGPHKQFRVGRVVQAAQGSSIFRQASPHLLIATFCSQH